MFTELYLTTTDPTKTLGGIYRENTGYILVSVIFHTLVYTIAFNLVSFILFNKWLSRDMNARLVGVLLVIMFFGYIGRYYHVKDIYKAYSNDKEKTREHVDKLFIGWIFIG
jgi:hypothetical protein